MKVSRLPIGEAQGYWAGNVVQGVGKGTHSLLQNTMIGVKGVVYEPYIGAKKKGIIGGGIGFFKGLSGLIYRPLRGCFDFVSQPVAGIINTPNYIYSRIKHKNGKSSRHRINFLDLSQSSKNRFESSTRMKAKSSFSQVPSLMEERKDECSGTTNEQLFDLPSGQRYITFGSSEQLKINLILTTPHQVEQSYNLVSDSD